MIITSDSDQKTIEIAKSLGEKISKGILCLYGDLGAGKTTFVRGLAKGLSVSSQVQSPTFTYQRIHQGRVKLYHFDFYRLQKADPLLSTEFLEVLEKQDGVVVIEWAERVKHLLPIQRGEIFFEYVDETTRRIRMELPHEKNMQTM